MDKRYAFFGFLVTLGVIIFMFLLGLVFTTIFQVSLTSIIGILSPIAFVILGLVSISLIFNLDIGRFIPKAKVKISKHPTISALSYGFFFGAIVIPCNPLFVAALFARVSLANSFLGNMLNFVFFGFGIGAPLLLFSLVSSKWSDKVIGFLTKHGRKINLITGVVMLWISIYYLTVVFGLFSLGFVSDFVAIGTNLFLNFLPSSFNVGNYGFVTPFILGLLTPLTAVCVLPLYPAFLAYLANQFDENKEKKIVS